MTVLRMAEILAYEDGFQYMITENTTPVTQNLFNKFPGYRTVWNLPFEALRLPGIPSAKPDMTNLDETWYEGKGPGVGKFVNFQVKDIRSRESVEESYAMLRSLI